MIKELLHILETNSSTLMGVAILILIVIGFNDFIQLTTRVHNLYTTLGFPSRYQHCVTRILDTGSPH